MRDFINKIKIQSKIIISFSIIGFGLIFVAAYQYNLYVALGGTEKSNKKILETIATINYLKTNLANIQYLQSEISESTDTTKIISHSQKWQQYNLIFKRNYNLISTSVVTQDIINFKREWQEINESIDKIRQQYDSLVVINMDSSLSLVKRRYKLLPQISEKFNAEDDAINEDDLVFLEDSINLDSAINDLDEIEVLSEIDYENYNFSMEAETNEADIQIKINEINDELLELKRTVNIGYQSLITILTKNEKTLYKIISMERKFIVKNAQTIINHSGFIIFLGIIFSFILTLWIIGKINVPIEIISKAIKELARGNLNVYIPRTKAIDELGTVQNDLKDALNNIKKINTLSQNIVEQNLINEYAPLSDDDELSRNLIKIKDNLVNQIKESEERKSFDKKYSWINDGIAKFNTLLRLHNQNLQILAENVLGELIKYIGAMQGGFFVKINSETNKQSFNLDLVTSYAYNRKKYFKRKIVKGEGLIGTVAVEGKKILLTKLPEDYLEIRSGLGGTEPQCLLVVPMIINDNILGVLEIASFNIFKDFEIEFIEKIAESIAASISSIKVNEQTSFLLEQSRNQTEELGKEQSERQQIIRELQSAQEQALLREQELKNTLKEIEEKNENLNEKDSTLKFKIGEATENYKKALNNIEQQQKLQSAIFERTLDGVIIINGQGYITYVNPSAEKVWNYTKEELIGEKINKLMPEPHSIEHDEYLSKYLETGLKKMIGKGRRVDILTKGNQTKAVYLEVIDTSFDNNIYFTGIIKDLSVLDNAQIQISTLKKTSVRQELKYENYISELSKIFKENNIEIPSLNDFGEKIIDKEKELLLNSTKLDPLRKEILKKLNTAYGLMNNDQMSQSVDAFNSLIKQFKDYFKFEEELIEGNGFEKTREHKKFHKKITIKLLEYKTLIKKDEIDSIYTYFDVIKKLVIEHFLNEDKNIIDFIN